LDPGRALRYPEITLRGDRRILRFFPYQSIFDFAFKGLDFIEAGIRRLAFGCCSRVRLLAAPLRTQYERERCSFNPESRPVDRFLTGRRKYFNILDSRDA